MLRGIQWWRHRVVQFVDALCARVDEKEIQEISSLLSEEEILLFRSMSSVDQRHSLKVYHSARDLALRHPDVKKNLLFRAALLHDVGKVVFSPSILERVLATFPELVLRCLFPWKREKVRVYRQGHALQSVRLVADEALHELLLLHGEPVTLQDSLELRLLKTADLLH